jgi:hypothetical protein
VIGEAVKRLPAASKNDFGRDPGAERGFEGVPGDEIHRSPEKTLQVVLEVHVAIEGGRRVELDQDVDVAARGHLAADSRAEQSERRHAHLRQHVALGCQTGNNIIATRDRSLRHQTSSKTWAAPIIANAWPVSHAAPSPRPGRAVQQAPPRSLRGGAGDFRDVK